MKKKILSLFTIGMLTAGALHAQLTPGNSLELIDLLGQNVDIVACGNIQCNTHSFSHGTDYSYPNASSPYNTLYVTWTTSTSAVYNYTVLLSDVDNASGGEMDYTVGPFGSEARLVVTKIGIHQYSFSVSTSDGVH